NPVRAGIVGSPGAYRWSSYRTNSTGAGSSFVTPHPSFLSLGETPLQRAEQYRGLIGEALPDATLLLIRQGLKTGLPVGDAVFAEDVETAVQRPLAGRKRGRPRKKKMSEEKGV